MRHVMIATAMLAMISAGCAKPGQPVETPKDDDTADEEPVGEDYDDADAAPSPAIDMRACTSADDCVSVACGCKCSGCGGFYFEDVVNKAHEDAWYAEKGCEKANVCPEVCCPGGMSVECEGGQCVVEGGGESLTNP